MRTEVTIDKKNKLTEILSVTGSADGDKKRVEKILLETWESADDWLY